MKTLDTRCQKRWTAWSAAVGAALTFGCGDAGDEGEIFKADPDLVARNATVASQTGLWFWMTQSGAGYYPPHEGILYHGFGETIRSINGALECNGGSSAVQQRVDYYTTYCAMLGVDPGPNLYC